MLRSAKATRHLTLVFVDGEKEKVALTRALPPDACDTTWGRSVDETWSGLAFKRRR